MLAGAVLIIISTSIFVASKYWLLPSCKKPSHSDMKKLSLLSSTYLPKLPSTD